MEADRLVVALTGSWPTGWEVEWLRKWQPFGVILFSRNVDGPSQLKELCAYLRTLVPNLQIMADHEGGPVSQLAQALGRPPAAWTLGALDDVDLTRRVHERTARLMVAAGVSWVLAPCADIMTNPHNPVIGVRAFGDTVDIVSRHITAAIRGLLAGGCKVCLKHWPGHGSAGQDSHLERAVLSEKSLDVASIPFHNGLSAGATAVMVGHLCFGDSSNRPATLDAGFLDATRSKLGGDNGELLLVADDITMGGLREPMADMGILVDGDTGSGLLDPCDLPKSWFQALFDAGSDLLLLRGLPLKAFPIEYIKENIQATSPTFVVDTVSVIPEYVETCTRASVGKQFFLSNDFVLFVDLTINDRWAVAAGVNHSRVSKLCDVLDRAFGKVVQVFPGDEEIEKDYSFTRVVLVSHRPLLWDNLNPPNWLGSLAEDGEAVVMGHPSLKADFFAALPGSLQANWQISALYDVTGADLCPGD